MPPIESVSSKPPRGAAATFGIPFTLVQRGSFAQFILSYAEFMKRAYRKDFSVADYMSFRYDKPRKETIVKATRKLLELGWLTETSPGRYTVTDKGADANRRIGKRNGLARAAQEAHRGKKDD